MLVLLVLCEFVLVTYQFSVLSRHWLRSSQLSQEHK